MTSADAAPVEEILRRGRHCQFVLGDPSAALRHYAEVLRIQPQTIWAHVHAAHCLLALGNAGEGWRQFGWTWHLPGVSRAVPHLPEWRPEQGHRRLLVNADMAFGEAIFFSRFLPLLGPGLDLTAAARPELCPLLESTGYFTACVDTNSLTRADAARFDAWVPLMKVPHLLGSSEPIAAEAARWTRLGAAMLPGPERPGLRVGVVWETSVKAHPWLGGRNCPLALFRLLFATEGCRFFSFQVGDAAADLARLPEGSDVIDLSPHLGDFAATARLLAAMDVVVTVDTAVANLAATMGVPTWVLLMRAADWRWGVGDHSVWFPEARLFRQDRQGEWTPVIERLCSALAEAARFQAARPQAV